MTKSIKRSQTFIFGELSSQIRLVGSILEEMKEITQYLLSSPDQTDKISVSVRH